MSPVAQQTPAVAAGRAASTVPRPAPPGPLAGCSPASHARGARHKHTTMPEQMPFLASPSSSGKPVTSGTAHWRNRGSNRSRLRQQLHKSPALGAPLWLGAPLLGAPPVWGALSRAARARRHGLLCGAGPRGLPRGQAAAAAVARGRAAQGDQGGCDQVVPDQVRGRRAQQAAPVLAGDLCSGGFGGRAAQRCAGRACAGQSRGFRDRAHNVPEPWCRM